MLTPELEAKFRRFAEIRFSKDHFVEGNDLWNDIKGFDSLSILFAEIEKLRDQLEIAREALTNWLSSTPTNKDGKYCEINQWHAYRAQEALAKMENGKLDRVRSENEKLKNDFEHAILERDMWKAASERIKTDDSMLREKFEDTQNFIAQLKASRQAIDKCVELLLIEDEKHG